MVLHMYPKSKKWHRKIGHNMYMDVPKARFNIFRSAIEWCFSQQCTDCNFLPQQHLSLLYMFFPCYCSHFLQKTSNASKGHSMQLLVANYNADYLAIKLEVQSNQKTFCFRLWFLHIRGKISQKFIWKWTLTHSQLKFQRLIFLPIWHFYCDDLWIQMKRWSCMLCLISKD